MRERITFVQPRGAGVDPKTLDLQEAGLLGPLIETVKEDRFTLTVEELPSDLSELLSELSELNIRWTTSVVQETLEPFASRISPGLHLSYTPTTPDAKQIPTKICQHLRDNFGRLEHCSPEASHLDEPVLGLLADRGQAFTSSSEASSSSKLSEFYIYEQHSDLREFSVLALRNICPELDTICHSRVRGLENASSLDISWDLDSSKLKVTAFWPLTEQSINVPQSTERRTEVGVLAQDVPPNMERHEAGVSGLLTVLGESKEPSPTLFSYPARHRIATGTFTSSFLTPTGLHPNLQLSLDAVKRPAAEHGSCQLFTYMTLPNVIFADRYQLGDDLFLASKNLTSLRHTTLPVDLEAPAYTTTVWGSSILLELAPAGDSWTSEVPLHLRYLRPSATGSVDIELPYPVIFWACEADAEASFATNPFDRRQLGYDTLFSDNTVFWHVTPQPSGPQQGRLINELKVPVLRDDVTYWIETGTGAAVSIGFLWILWVLFRAIMRPSARVERPVENRKKE